MAALHFLLVLFFQFHSSTALSFRHSSRISLARLRPRSTSNNTVPAPINIAPSQYWEGNDGPWSTFPLQVGTGAEDGLQNVRVLPSTAATSIWAIGAEGCPNGYITDCPDNRGGLFMPNQSLTWAPDSIYQTGLEANLGLDSSGDVGFDVATLGWQGSAAEVSDLHAIIFSMADPRFWLGMFGLNPRPTNLSNFNDPQTSFMESLFESNKIPSLSYGYTAGNQYRFNGVYGSLTLGGYDQNRFIKNNVTFSFNENISRDLSVNLQSIGVSSSSSLAFSFNQSINIFIDSTVPGLWLPEAACKMFEKSLGLQYDDKIARYTISASLRQKLLASNLEFTFTLGPQIQGGDTVKIKLPYNAFDLQLDFPIITGSVTGPTYYFPLQRAANDTQYTLGRAFLQEAYIIVDYERQNFSVSQCAWVPNAVTKPELVPIVSSRYLQTNDSTHPGKSDQQQPSHSLSTTTLAAAIVVVALLFAFFGLLIILLHRRKQRRKRLAAEAEAEAEKNSLQSSLSKSDISAPFGGELTGENICEAPPNTCPNEVPGGGYGGLGKFGYSEMDAKEKGVRVEVQGSVPVYEMPASDVFELGDGRRSQPVMDGRRGGRFGGGREGFF